MIAAMAEESGIRRLMRHLKLASVPPPLAPARSRQDTFAWVAAVHNVARGLVGDVRVAEVYLTPLSV